ncbi:MAG: OmpH family outer membrane protein, partial [Saprospiraceae bacterium]
MAKFLSIQLFLLLCITGSGFAQAKYAHINSGNLLAQMPEVKSADNQLIALRKTMVTDGNKRLAAFEKKYQAFVSSAQAGSLTKAQIATQEKALQTEQEGLMKYDKQI